MLEKSVGMKHICAREKCERNGVVRRHPRDPNPALSGSVHADSSGCRSRPYPPHLGPLHHHPPPSFFNVGNLLSSLPHPPQQFNQIIHNGKNQTNRKKVYRWQSPKKAVGNQGYVVNDMNMEAFVSNSVLDHHSVGSNRDSCLSVVILLHLRCLIHTPSLTNR